MQKKISVESKLHFSVDASIQLCFLFAVGCCCCLFLWQLLPNVPSSQENDFLANFMPLFPKIINKKEKEDPDIH